MLSGKAAARCMHHQHHHRNTAMGYLEFSLAELFLGEAIIGCVVVLLPHPISDTIGVVELKGFSAGDVCQHQKHFLSALSPCMCGQKNGLERRPKPTATWDKNRDNLRLKAQMFFLLLFFLIFLFIMHKRNMENQHAKTSYRVAIAKLAQTISGVRCECLTPCRSLQLIIHPTTKQISSWEGLRNRSQVYWKKVSFSVPSMLYGKLMRSTSLHMSLTLMSDSASRLRHSNKCQHPRFKRYMVKDCSGVGVAYIMVCRCPLCCPGSAERVIFPHHVLCEMSYGEFLIVAEWHGCVLRRYLSHTVSSCSKTLLVQSCDMNWSSLRNSFTWLPHIVTKNYTYHFGELYVSFRWTMSENMGIPKIHPGPTIFYAKRFSKTHIVP